eukprot:c20302_g4_i1 orf=91-408(+)
MEVSRAPLILASLGQQALPSLLLLFFSACAHRHSLHAPRLQPQKPHFFSPLHRYSRGAKLHTGRQKASTDQHVRNKYISGEGEEMGLDRQRKRKLHHTAHIYIYI